MTLPFSVCAVPTVATRYIKNTKCTLIYFSYKWVVNSLPANAFLVHISRERSLHRRPRPGLNSGDPVAQSRLRLRNRQLLPAAGLHGTCSSATPDSAHRPTRFG